MAWCTWVWETAARRSMPECLFSHQLFICTPHGFRDHIPAPPNPCQPLPAGGAL